MENFDFKVLSNYPIVLTDVEMAELTWCVIILLFWCVTSSHVLSVVFKEV